MRGGARQECENNDLIGVATTGLFGSKDCSLHSDAQQPESHVVVRESRTKYRFSHAFELLSLLICLRVFRFSQAL